MGALTIWISVDFEGLASTVSWQQDHGSRESEFRRLMTAEVNAAIAGAKEAGATRIIVNDSHDQMLNLLPEELDPDAELILGSPKPLSMLEGVDSGVDGAFFVGYHAASGTWRGTMDHTYSNRAVLNVWINGTKVGETGINAGLCGALGVPVLLVSGDSAATREARELLGPEVVTVSVKEAVGKFAARCLHPARARELLREGAARAVRERDRIRPFRFQPPYRFEVELAQTVMADMAELVPFTRRVDGRRLVYEDEDYIRGFRALRAMIALAYGAV
ncbi:MAG: M55 family metallopeptidase [Limnochordales bacterium]|nr:M55 family metallopeptidase [Limnochordales bacterium]